MPSVQAGSLPETALLAACRDAGEYTDCYYIDCPGTQAFDDYVTAFYCSWLFRIERWILRCAVSRPSTDAEARELALGQRDTFAAWQVEARAENQLLLTDFRGSTRSWLMVNTLADVSGETTRLYFGSAVVPKHSGNNRGIGLLFVALMGFHRLYSRLLLGAARRRLLKPKLDSRSN